MIRRQCKYLSSSSNVKKKKKLLKVFFHSKLLIFWIRQRVCYLRTNFEYTPTGNSITKC